MLPVISHRRFLPWLLLLFFGSGCAALIYEIVWLQLLELIIGSSSISLGVLLGAFMGGMCLGSILLPRFVSSNRHPLRIYALLELGIGVFGVLILYATPHLGNLYAALPWHGIFVRALIAIYQAGTGQSYIHGVLQIVVAGITCGIVRVFAAIKL